MVSVSLIVFALLGMTSVYASLADFDCFERADGGPGRAYIESYAWQPRTRTCSKFIYGGMAGNRNRFATAEECDRSCHDAVLRRQLNFSRAQRYNLVNRLDSTLQIACNLEAIDDGYFTLVLPPNGKVLGISMNNGTASLDVQVANGAETQQWDIIPTGESDYYRIKTRSRKVARLDALFLQASINETVRINVARRDTAYLGQQWRIL